MGEAFSTLYPNFHPTPLIISWCGLANLTVYVAIFRWSKYSFYIHLILALTIFILTLLATIPYLQVYISQMNQGQGQLQQTIHDYVGLVLVCLLGVQIIFGILSRTIRYSKNTNPNVCIWIRRAHMISSYIILVLAKFNYLNAQYPGEVFNALLAIDIICIIIYLLIKFKYFTFSQVLTNYEKIFQIQKRKQNCCSWIFLRIKNYFNPSSPFSYNQKLIQSLYIPKFKSQLEILHQNYVIFNDYVYDTTPLKGIHPGGQYIIQNTNKRQIDRFIYGVSPLQILPDVNPHKHSKDSLYILGSPIGRIEIESPFNGMNQYNFVNIVKKAKLGVQSSTYFLSLKIFNQNSIIKQFQTTERKALPQTNLKFLGYKNQNQFGQYFTLSIVDRKDNIEITRLYTTIWCMRPQNIKFIQTNFSAQFINRIKQEVIALNFRESQMKTRGSQQQIIPLVIKKYQTGQFTSKLLDENFKGICVISKPMGKGMAFHRLNPDGKVILICGGTGILPFCDFIDILFKRAKYLEKNNLSLILQQKDSIIRQDLFKKRQFILYHAVQQVDDIPQIILYQINELCASVHINFKAIIRISKKQQNFPESYKKNITLTKEYFNQQIRKQHLSQEQRDKLNMIYICGSKKINQQIGNILINEKISQNLYHFM